MKWLNRGYDRSAVDDIFQETMRRVLEKLQAPEGIKSPASFGAFVFTISNNVVKERNRYTARQGDQIDDTSLDFVSPDLNGEQTIVRDEEREAVRRTLRLMKPREAQILIAIYINGQHKDEVCDEHDITRSNLRLVLHRAIVRFKFLYQSEKGKPPQGERPLSEP